MALIKGTNSNNTLGGTTSADEIYAYGGNDKVYGYGGNDWIDGGAGNDILYGGAGNDDLIGGTGINTLYGGAGADWFRMSARSSALSDDYIADFTLDSDKIDLRAWGVSDFSQVKALLGNTADGGSLLNAYYGGYNHYIEIANVTKGKFISSDFVFDTSAKALSISGTGSGDVLFGGRGDDLIHGNGGNDKLLGGIGDDDIFGGAGNDQIWGGQGSDYMSGGSGNDIFRFAAISEMTSSTGRDIIKDFQVNDSYGYDDRIDFSQIDADATRAGNQAFDFIGGKKFISNSPGELRYYYNSAGNTVVAGNVDNDATPEFEIVLIGKHNLDVSDFIV
ncbi:M10 family metallopeptidase C-terminal domain-containing protein [Pseudaminobacter sp. 19-2017]|uniref:M10 family metallopeptidase C-terminal domain-containing protein n=1 Tax=Pseudaminobacter soli (ex Zhang et al. 2022) TaxID=2831468 RepID=A0A942I405_9HYPH|nr:M10 family metallopeptidase C-terminal domain-containing protein [Pseudaminobacter soli]MBS3650704.1 M10 family metallopeptidase C-terminal domain-containing protein [Pseudaminobacter soli]